MGRSRIVQNLSRLSRGADEFSFPQRDEAVDFRSAGGHEKPVGESVIPAGKAEFRQQAFRIPIHASAGVVSLPFHQPDISEVHRVAVVLEENGQWVRALRFAAAGFVVQFKVVMHDHAVVADRQAGVAEFVAE